MNQPGRELREERLESQALPQRELVPPALGAVKRGMQSHQRSIVLNGSLTVSGTGRAVWSKLLTRPAGCVAADPDRRLRSQVLESLVHPLDALLFLGRGVDPVVALAPHLF